MLSSHQIASTIIEPNKKILHLGCGDQELKTLVNPSHYVGVDIKEPADLLLNVETTEELPGDFDYVVVAGLLEQVEDPVEVIKKIKSLAKTIVILESKYTEDYIKPYWKKHWKDIGLEWNIQQMVEYHRAIYLGHTTIHECKEKYYVVK